MTRILLVDDHPLFRRGLASLLGTQPDFEVVAQASDANQALQLTKQHQPDIIMLDLHLPGVSGAEVLPELLRAAPKAQVLMLTMSEDQNNLLACLRAGASGYLLKSIDAAEMIDAINKTLQHETVLSASMTSKLVQQFTRETQERAVAVNLSPRESDVLRGIALGKSNKEIAQQLDIAETTVKIHVQHLLRKLELTSRLQAAVWALQNKFL